jgi:uracil-DNA glycosylase
MIAKELLLELKKMSQIEEVEIHFERSGMLNKFEKLEYGFFPLGNGDLSNCGLPNSKNRILVLGNDFGTTDYLQECFQNGNKESDTKYPTIRNLKGKLGLNLRETFFTNIHLGVRRGGKNTKREVPLTYEYRLFCYHYLIKQLEIVDPQFVICLGHEVRETLAMMSGSFSKWKPKNISIKKLHSNGGFSLNINDIELGKRKFILLPHPCDGRNFNEEYIKGFKDLILDVNN